MVNAELNRGGAARMAATLANGLVSLGGNTDVSLYHCQYNQDEPPFYGRNKLLSRQINAVIARLMGSTATIDFGVSTEILGKLKSADVLHIHNLHGYYLNYKNLLMNCSDKPVVWTWHDMWGATGRCGFAHECTGWNSGCEACPNMKYYPAAWIDRAAIEFKVKSQLYSKLKKLHIVTPSQWLADIAIDRGFSEDKVTVIPNPVDLSQYRPLDVEPLRKELGIELNEFYALFVAADCNDPRKGYEDFEKVIESTGTKGIVVGIPPLRKSANIHYVGTLNSSEGLSKWYATSDLMVITSKADNYPNTVIESLACGTPVCGYAIGGVPSQVPEGWNYLVEPGDIGALVENVNRFKVDVSVGIAVRSRLSEYAKEKWDPEVIAKKYYEIYAMLL